MYLQRCVWGPLFFHDHTFQNIWHLHSFRILAYFYRTYLWGVCVCEWHCLIRTILTIPTFLWLEKLTVTHYPALLLPSVAPTPWQSSVSLVMWHDDVWVCQHMSVCRTHIFFLRATRQRSCLGDWKVVGILFVFVTRIKVERVFLFSQWINLLT